MLGLNRPVQQNQTLEVQTPAKYEEEQQFTTSTTCTLRAKQWQKELMEEGK